MTALADAYALLKSGTLWHNTSLGSPNHPCKGFADANPGEAAKIDSYVAALSAGTSTAPPVLATDTGRGLVGMLAALAPVAPAPAPPPPAPTSGSAYEFRLGDPAKGFDASSTTSTGWTRQAGVPAHVSFSTEKWFGDWQAVDCLIQPADPILYGQQRSQIIHGTDSQLVPGVGKWLSVPFKTNAGYKPQSHTANPNFNCLGLCLHEPNDFYAYPSPTVKTTTPQAPFNVVVCTTDPNTYPAVALPEPRLGFMVYGGTPSAQWYSQGKRFLGPVFQPGHLYVLDIFYLESSDPTKGQIEIWVDGVQVVPRTTLATTWKNLAGVDATLYFCLQNYRPAVSEITWDNVVSWCGVRVGDDRASTSFLTAA